MKFNIKRLVEPEETDKSGLLKSDLFFAWLYNEIIRYATSILESQCLIRHISNVDIIHPVKKKDILEIDVNVKATGKTSITLNVFVNDVKSRKTFLKVENVVLVSVDEDLKAREHNCVSVGNKFIPYPWTSMIDPRSK